MSLLHARGPARIDANLTPLIDLAFLLIVFFVLVARMGGDQLPPVALPKPTHPAMTPAGGGQRVALNVFADGDRTILSLGSRRFSDDDAGQRDLASALAQRIRKDPTAALDIRADRTLRYDMVEPALKALAEAASLAGAPRVTIRVCALEQGVASTGGTDSDTIKSGGAGAK